MSEIQPDRPAYSSTICLDVISSSLVLLHTCEVDDSSTNILEGELQELTHRFVEACNELGLVPVVAIDDFPDLPF